MNFIISIVVLAVSVFILGVAIRYGLTGAGRLDDYFSSKTNRSFYGFNWFYRIPSKVGFIPEYFFFLVIGRENYFKTNWWAIKTSGLLSILIALATVNGRSTVYNYFSLALVKNEGFLALFTSGLFVWYLNIIVLTYVALFVLIVIESIKMHGLYSPVRIFTYSLLSFLMADLSIIVIGLVVAVILIYIVFKIIVFFFFSSKKHADEEPDEEASGILKRGLRSFRKEVIEWEAERKTVSNTHINKSKPRVKVRRKKPKITRKPYKSNIPRLHPD